MSCPDWHALAAHRLADPGPGSVSGSGSVSSSAAATATPSDETPAGWREALAHLDGCAACRDRALAADPTLLFRRLPEVTADAELVRDVRRGVETLRRARRVEARALRGPGVLAGALAASGPSVTPRSDGLEPFPGTRAPGSFSGGFPVSGLAGAEALAAVGTEEAALDQIERPDASVYHIDDDQLAVVMVVDASLDV